MYLLGIETLKENEKLGNTKKDDKEPDENLLAQLINFGVNSNGAKRTLIAVKNSSLGLFIHLMFNIL